MSRDGVPVGGGVTQHGKKIGCHENLMSLKTEKTTCTVTASSNIEKFDITRHQNFQLLAPLFPKCSFM